MTPRKSELVLLDEEHAVSIPTRQAILELSEMSPVLHSSIAYWKDGAITWEQAMMLAVMELDILSKQYQIELEEQHEGRIHEG